MILFFHVVNLTIFMGSKMVAVPLHKIILNSDLFNGQVLVGVCPALPVDRLMIILGNYIAGSKVWEDVPPLARANHVPQVNTRPDESVAACPDVFLEMLASVA